MARRIAAMLFACGIFSPLSNACTVRTDTLARLANSAWDQPSQPRAARHCSGITTKRHWKIRALAENACFPHFCVIYANRR